MTAAEMVVEKARKSISRFCIEECHAYCCRKGYLVMGAEEMKTVLQGKKDELEKIGALKLTEKGAFSLNLGNPLNCPSLKDNKCLVHKSKKRPKACRDFPIFIQGKTARFSKRCPAVRKGLFYVCECEMMKEGVRVG